MRNYTNTLLFESALDSIPTTNQAVYNAAFNFFVPTVMIVEEDCGTMLGTEYPLDKNLIGLLEVDTDATLTYARLVQIAESGILTARVRTLQSCISQHGVCKTCLTASRPRLSGLSVGGAISLPPELLISTTSINLSSGSTSIHLPYSSDLYDRAYVYQDGVLLAEGTYSISGSTLTLGSATTSIHSYLIKFYVVSNVCYYYWLTDKYSGSLLGIKPLVDLPLPLKDSLLRELVNEGEIDDIWAILRNSSFADEDFVQYIPEIKDPLEKAIFVILLGSILLS